MLSLKGGRPIASADIAGVPSLKHGVQCPNFRKTLRKREKSFQRVPELSIYGRVFRALLIEGLDALVGHVLKAFRVLKIILKKALHGVLYAVYSKETARRTY